MDLTTAACGYRSTCVAQRCSHGANKHHRVAEQITKSLLEDSILAVARSLDMREQLATDGPKLVQIMHQAGVNLRFLGKVRSHVTGSFIRQLVLVEMIARTARVELYRLLRRTGTAAICQFFNALFGNTDASGATWMRVASIMSVKYAVGIEEAEAASESSDPTNLSSCLNKLPLFVRFCDLCEIFPTSSALEMVAGPGDILFSDTSSGLTASLEAVPRCKTIFDPQLVVDALRAEAQRRTSTGGDFHESFVELATPVFDSHNRDVLIAKLKSCSSMIRSGRAAEAVSTATAALAMWPQQYETRYVDGLCILGTAYEAHNDGDGAIRTYTRALEIAVQLSPTHPVTGKVLCSLARVQLRYRASAEGKAVAICALQEAFKVYETTHNAQVIDFVLPSVATGKAEEIGESLGKLCSDIRTILDTVDEMKGPDETTGSVDTWTCTACTLLNVLTEELCTVCHAPRPTDVLLPEATHSSQVYASATLALMAGQPVYRDKRQAKEVLDRVMVSLDALEDFLGHPRGYFYSASSVSSAKLLRSSSSDRLPTRGRRASRAHVSGASYEPSGNDGASLIDAVFTASEMVVQQAGSLMQLTAKLTFCATGLPVNVAVEGLTADIVGPQHVQCLLTLHGDGLVDVHAVVTRAGDYTVRVLRSGVAVASAPVQVVPAAPDAFSSSFTIPNTIRRTDDAVFRMRCLDIFGNACFPDKDHMYLWVQSGTYTLTQQLGIRPRGDSSWEHSKSAREDQLAVVSRDPDRFELYVDLKQLSLTGSVVRCSIMVAKPSRDDPATLSSSLFLYCGEVRFEAEALKKFCNRITTVGSMIGTAAFVCGSCNPPQSSPCIRCGTSGCTAASTASNALTLEIASLAARVMMGGSAASICRGCDIAMVGRRVCVSCGGNTFAHVRAKTAMLCQHCASSELLFSCYQMKR